MSTERFHAIDQHSNLRTDEMLYNVNTELALFKSPYSAKKNE